MSGLDEFKATFFQECGDLLENMERGLMAIDSGESPSDHIDSIFRAVHSVKGGAGAFDFSRLVSFAHVFETVLDHIRHGKLEPTEDINGTLLRAGDILTDLVAMARDDTAVPDDFGAEVLDDLNVIANADEHGDEGDASPEEFDDIDFTPVTADELDRAFDERQRRIHVRFRPYPNLYRSANDPQILLRELNKLGSLQVAASVDQLPDLAHVDPTGAYIGWTMTLETTGTVSDVHEVFEFVEDDCELSVSEIVDDDENSSNPVVRNVAMDTGETTQEHGEIGQSNSEKAAGPLETPVDAGSPSAAEAEVESKRQPKAQEEGNKGERTNAKESASPATIRVDLDRVDRVVDSVGELVITQAMLIQTVHELPPDGNYTVLWRTLEEMAHVTRELQECVMAMRAQPVNSVFQRMPRLVREVAGRTGKKVRLVVTGETTEVDKTVTERLADPLTHMIRNAIDHGLELPEERSAAAKPQEGTVRLSAEHRGGRIIIELSDDGRGINRKRVREKAIENNLIAPDAELSDEETDNLIFLPGFSTASQVSELSGRGVGMDVVRRNVEAIGGRVAIRSVEGQGSTFRMTLPLTLAVMEGMVFSVASETYIMPLANIVECLRLTPKDIQTAAMGGHFLVIRGEVIPLIYLWQYFSIDNAKSEKSEGVVVVIDVEGGTKAGVVVDEIRGQQQVVVKSIESNYGKIDGAAAATVLGNGQVALILDADAFGRMVSIRGGQRAAH